MAYILDPITNPGDILIRTDDHPCYSAQTFTIAEQFAKQLGSPDPIALPEYTESTLDDQREQRIARVLARIVLDGIADAAVARSARIAAQVEATCS
jgi:hypothetical protein